MYKVELNENNTVYGGMLTEEDVIYTCYLIEVISRGMLQRNKYTANKIGKNGLYDLMCYSRDFRIMDPWEAAEEIISDFGIVEGTFNI